MNSSLSFWFFFFFDVLSLCLCFLFFSFLNLAIYLFLSPNPPSSQSQSVWEKNIVWTVTERPGKNAGLLRDLTNTSLLKSCRVYYEQRPRVKPGKKKKASFEMLNAWELCLYLLQFKRLETSLWATKIQSDRTLQIFIAVHLIKFTFTSCQFEMLDKGYILMQRSRSGCSEGPLLPTYTFSKYSE